MATFEKNYSNITPPFLGCGPQTRSPLPGTYPYYIALYAFPFWFFIGTIGNILILTVLRKMKQKKNSAFLMALAFSDFCFFIPMFINNLSAYDSLALDEKFLKFWYHSVTIIVALANWFSTASNWFVVCIAVERLTAIGNPLRARRVWKGSVLTVIIVIVFILSAAIQTPRLFGYSVISSIHENKTVYCYAYEHGHVNFIMIKISRTILPFISVIIPMIMLTILNGFLLYFVHRSQNNVTLLGSTNRNLNDTETKVTRLVLAILITFFILNFPAAVIGIWLSVEKNFQRLKFLTNLPVHTTNNMVTLNKVLNFFIYFCSSSQFRKKLRLMWRNFRRNKPSIWQSVSRRTSSVVSVVTSLASSTKSKQRYSLDDVNLKPLIKCNKEETNF